MKIGIDARMLGSEQGGLGRYIEQLILHLSMVDYENEYIIFVRSKNVDKVKIANEQFKYTKVLTEIPWYGWREQILFSGIIKKMRVNLMHFPHWNVPLFYNAPFVVTIHDLLLLKYPTRAASKLGPIGYWFKNFAYRLVLRHAVAHARHIIVVSEFTKQDVHKKLSIPLEKMTVIYQAPFLKNDGMEIKNKIKEITKPYILYVGVSYPHKNLDRLIEAWKIIQAKSNYKYQLVLTGKKNFFYKRLENKINGEKITDVIITDFVPDTDLPALYKNAALFVFPSLYEGFGLPPLEAWMFNVPVVASNAGSIPEILGTGALYFDPESTEQMADVIFQGLTNSEIRQELRLAARLELPRYSWDKLAVETRAIYEKLFRER